MPVPFQETHPPQFIQDDLALTRHLSGCRGQIDLLNDQLEAIDRVVIHTNQKLYLMTFLEDLGQFTLHNIRQLTDPVAPEDSVDLGNTFLFSRSMFDQLDVMMPSVDPYLGDLRLDPYRITEVQHQGTMDALLKMR